MNIFVLILLGAVQGLCEFLPISSSGHLVLLSKIFNVENSLFISIVLHLATLLAVIIVFWNDIKYLVLHPFSNRMMQLCLSTIFTAIIILILLPIVKLSFSGEYLFICFFISAIILFLVDIISKNKKTKEFSLKTAIIMGIAQGFAVFPGISRSGTTISAGLISGYDKKECAKFSFILSIPIILLSMVEEIFELATTKQTLNVNFAGLILGFIIAFIIGILTIRLMIKITEKTQFKWFGFYLLILSSICIIFL